MRRDDDREALRGTRRAALLVFVTAIAARGAAFALAFDPALVFEKYLLLARRLVADGFAPREPWAFSPAYTCFVAILLRLGAAARGIAWAQIVLGAGACVLVSLLGRRLFGRGAGLIAGLGAALYGPFLMAAIELEADGLGLLFFLGAAAAAARAVQSPDRSRMGRAVGWFAAAGLLLGLRMAHRPDAIVTLLALPVAVALFAGARPALASLAMLPAALAVVTPIAWQNQRAAHEWIPVTSSGGWVLYTSHNWQGRGLSYFPPPLAWQWMNAPADAGDPLDRLDDRVSRRLASLASDRELTAAETSRFWGREARASIRRRGGEAQAALQARRFFYMLHDYEAHDDLALLVKEERLGRLARGMGIVAPLAVLGLLASLFLPGFWRRHGSWLLPFALLPLVSMSVFYVGARFRLELAALLLPFAAAGVLALLRALRERRLGALATGTALVAALAILLHLPDAEIARQTRLRAVELHTFLGRRVLRERGDAPGDDAAGKEFHAAVTAAATPAEAAEAWEGLATVLEARGDPQAAGEARVKASGLLEPDDVERLRERPDDPEALWALARHSLLRREPAEAAVVLRHAVALSPDDPDLQFALASAAFDAGGTPAGLVLARLRQAFDAGLRFTTNAASGYVLEGRLLLMLDRNDEARAAFRSALRYEPDNAVARRLLSDTSR